MIKILENLQLCSTFLIPVALIPAIIKVLKEKSKASNVLNLTTTTLYVSDTLLRLPNVGRGLFKAIQSNNKEDIKRNAYMCAGIWAVSISMYILLVLIAVYDTDTKKTKEREQKYKNFLKIVIPLFILSILSYSHYGFNISTYTITLAAIIYSIIQLIIWSKDKELNKTNREKRDAIVSTFLYGIFMLYVIIYYYNGIKHSIHIKKKI